MNAVGKTFIATERTEAIAVNPMTTRYQLPNGERVPVRFSILEAPTNDTTELVPAVTGKKIRILAALIHNGATATTLTFKSGTTVVSLLIDMAVREHIELAYNVQGVFPMGAISEAINVTLSKGGVISIMVQFVEIPDDCFDLM